MPKLKDSTARFRTRKLVKSCVDNDFNQEAIARQEGVTQQAISQRLQKKPVRDALTKYFDSRKIAKKIAKRMDEGLDAMKSVGKDEVEDLHCRHKYINTYMQVTGRIKTNGNGGANKTTVIIYGHRGNNRDSDSTLRNSEGRLGASA